MKKRKEKHVEFYGGRIKPLVEAVAKLVAEHPDLGRQENFGRLHASLASGIEGYGKPSVCFNCKRSMKITEYEADLHDALLILAMAKAVKENMKNGLLFTEANKIHLPTLQASNATIKRQTKCDYLGLVKQPDNWRGSGHWVLTGWAWKALRGDPIPKSAKYWEGHMIGRSEETITLSEMFKKHRDLVERAIAKRSAIKADHRAQFNDYDPGEWSKYGGDVDGLRLQGELL